MDRTAFHRLLKKYLDGTCSAEESALINQWYELLDDHTVLEPGKSEIQEIESRMWNTIKDRITEPAYVSATTGANKRPQRIWLKWSSVAAITLLFTIGISLLYKARITHAPASLIHAKVAEGLLQEINNSNSVRQLTLEDGSVVTLQPSARCAFPRHFTKDKREVYLEGEAFFVVSKNAARPFFVYNGKLVTQVLGTSFNVKIVSDKIEVAVQTGRVAVYENSREVSLNEQQKKNNGVIITPNQKVTYYNENRHFITSLVDSPVLLPGEHGQRSTAKFVFDDTPLSEVLETLEKNYAIEIILANKELYQCPFTGDLSQQSIFNKLEFICQAFQATYEIKGTRILINGGKGCL